MRFIQLIIIFIKLLATLSIEFPDKFLFGVATSAYQIEGGSKYKGDTVFDYHQRLDPSLVADKSNATIACDSYHQYQDDINLLADLGVDFYRFSISWARIFPNGYPILNQINPSGIAYYNSLIDGILSKNIQPMVTIHHMDLPQSLQKIGGWTNPLLSDLFSEYSKVLFKAFGDRVKIWITINTSLSGLGDDKLPPKLNQSGIGEYLGAKTMILAHAKVYRLYQKEFRKSQNGHIGFVIDGRWYEPATDEDLEATERVREFNVGLLLNPILVNGDYPEIVKKRLNELSVEEGILRRKLLDFTTDEKEMIKNSTDFLGLNIYTSFLVKENREKLNFSFRNDYNATIFQNSNWEKSQSKWLKVTPWALRKFLKWIKDKYNNPSIFITENGFSDNGELDDFKRINYLEKYLRVLLDAIYKDGVKVKGYTVWSLLDNFEWLAGYSEKFGLYHVNFTDPGRKRTPKLSSNWYKNLIARKTLNDLKSEL